MAIAVVLCCLTWTRAWQAQLPILVYLKKQRRSLEETAARTPGLGGGTLEDLQRRFKLFLEEDFAPADVGHRDVVVFYDCERSSRGRLLVPGGSFRDVLSRDADKSRLFVVLANEDERRETRLMVTKAVGALCVLTDLALPEQVGWLQTWYVIGFRVGDHKAPHLLLHVCLMTLHPFCFMMIIVVFLAVGGVTLSSTLWESPSRSSA
jgi:hypothetical protein